MSPDAAEQGAAYSPETINEASAQSDVYPVQVHSESVISNPQILHSFNLKSEVFSSRPACIVDKIHVREQPGPDEASLAPIVPPCT